MKTTIVTTTINVPTFLEGYHKNATHFGHEVDYVVVGDKKTAWGVAEFCKSIPNCHYMSVDTQREYMASRFTKLWVHMPFNSVERRNVGMLLAYEKGADVIITLDDDNLATSQDMVGLHSRVGWTTLVPTYGSSSGWFNVCQFLKEENDVEFYHRGYSPKHRWEKDAFVSMENTSSMSVVNAGFWLDDPDVDAVTRLERKIRVTGYKDGFRGTIALAPGTWTPFDCQNTALLREIIPAYFLSPYIGRHSDIFASYVINRLAEHFGHVITFGNPWVLHNHHPHNLLNDFEIEKEGMRLTDSFCDALRGIQLSATTYHEGFGQIVEGLSLWAYLNGQEKITEGMALWHEAFKELK